MNYVTACVEIHFQTLNVAHLVNCPLANTKSSLSFSQKPKTSRYSEPVHAHSSYARMIHFNLILPTILLSTKQTPSVRFFNHNFVHIYLLSHTCHMSYPSHSTSFYHPNNVWQICTASHITFCSLTVISYLLDTYIFNNLFSSKFSLYISLNVRGHVLQSGSNMTGTDLCVNKPHCAAAVRPWESEATTSNLPPARVTTCSVLSGSC